MRWNLKRDAVALLVLAASVGLSWYSYVSLPALVPSHFSLDGTPDAYASKGFLVLMELGVMVFLYLLLTYLPRIDPFWKRIQNRYYVLLLFRDIIMVFMLFLFAVTVRSAYTGRLNMDLFGIGFGLLFILMGNLLPRLPRNFFVGIRTPWTIASDVVWKKTHIVSGWLFVAGGLLICVLSLFGLPVHWALLSVLLPILLFTGFVYPYILFHKLQREGESPTPDL
jgi:uncharacterized membrane protein